MHRRFIISVDIGQTNEYTAITVIEEIRDLRGGKFFHVGHIERMEAGTTYHTIIQRINELRDRPEFKQCIVHVVVDLTAVGKPVWELLEKQCLGCVITGVFITGGDSVTEEERCIFRVPKRDLITSLQLVLQGNALVIAEGLPEGDAFRSGLASYGEKKVSLNMHGHVENWREGANDGIVLSVAIGVWDGVRGKPFDLMDW